VRWSALLLALLLGKVVAADEPPIRIRVNAKIAQAPATVNGKVGVMPSEPSWSARTGRSTRWTAFESSVSNARRTCSSELSAHALGAGWWLPRGQPGSRVSCRQQRQQRSDPIYRTTDVPTVLNGEPVLPPPAGAGMSWALIVKSRMPQLGQNNCSSRARGSRSDPRVMNVGKRSPRCRTIISSSARVMVT
jgi:hypothetical protein